MCLVVVLPHFFLQMPLRNRKKLGARAYQRYTEEAIQRAVQAMRNGMSSREAERLFHVPRRTLLNKVKAKHSGKIGHPLALTEVEERHMVDVVIASAEYGCPLTTLEIRMLVKQYLDSKGVRVLFFPNNNLPSCEWVQAFMRRYKHILTHRHCQNVKRSRAANTEELMEEYFENLKKSIEGVEPHNILNYDETNLSDNPGIQKCVFRRGTKYPERYMNTTKSAISLMFAASATGERLPLYVVYKAERLYDRWITGGPPHTIYNRTKSGWFDAATFQDWFSKVVVPWAKRNTDTKVVIGDNLSSHINIDILKSCQRLNIRFVLLPPNSTGLTQPLDVGFYRPLKRAWKTLLTDLKTRQPNLNAVEKNIFPQLLTKLIEKIDPNFETNMINSFRATGIQPLNPYEVLKKMPNERFKNRVSSEIDNALISFLQQKKNGDANIKKGKKKLLNIRPGSSVQYEELQIDENNNIQADENNLEEREISDQEENEDEAYSDHDEPSQVEEDDDTDPYIDPNDLNVGSFIVVQFPTKKTIRYFIGIILEIVNTDSISYTTKFFRKNKNEFSFPTIDDISDVAFGDIIKVLSKPSVSRRGLYSFRENLVRFNL